MVAAKVMEEVVIVVDGAGNGSGRESEGCGSEVMTVMVVTVVARSSAL